ncbi:hypothetical protein J6590_055984 [Homalodisca vitripennis]|nr:hypothetical protein J6590_055984 [Homalodisca vitripennis]
MAQGSTGLVYGTASGPPIDEFISVTSFLYRCPSCHPLGAMSTTTIKNRQSPVSVLRVFSVSLNMYAVSESSAVGGFGNNKNTCKLKTRILVVTFVKLMTNRGVGMTYLLYPVRIPSADPLDGHRNVTGRYTFS